MPRLLYLLSWVSGFAGLLGGMGVGAFLWHRVGERARSPLAATIAWRWFPWIE